VLAELLERAVRSGDADALDEYGARALRLAQSLS
jgi:hypothetical protein